MRGGVMFIESILKGMSMAEKRLLSVLDVAWTESILGQRGLQILEYWAEK